MNCFSARRKARATRCTHCPARLGLPLTRIGAMRPILAGDVGVIAYGRALPVTRRGYDHFS
jgi:hypothetical protein